MKTISISLYKRPKYTKILLDHLDRCFDIENYKIFICCEPGHNEVIDMAKNFRTNQTTTILNRQKLGCTKNIYQCLYIGFNNSNFHIHLEDDIIPGKDFLLYCQYHEIMSNDQDIFSICGYNKDHLCNNRNSPSLSTTRQWFNPWGWATWVDRWNNIIVKSFEKSFTSHISWDVILHNMIRDKLEIYPLISRTQNIGAEHGTYCPGSEWHKQNQYNEYWIETDKQYQESFTFNKYEHKE